MCHFFGIRSLVSWTWTMSSKWGNRCLPLAFSSFSDSRIKSNKFQWHQGVLGNTCLLLWGAIVELLSLKTTCGCLLLHLGQVIYRGDCLDSGTFFGGHYLEMHTKQFTRELFLYISEVHIVFSVSGKPLFGLFWPTNSNPRKASHLRHFWFFGSLQTLHMP
jgi:hypothetical protein